MFCQIALAIFLVIAPQTPQTVAEQQLSAKDTPPEAPWPPVGVYRPGKGVTMPRIVKEETPKYRAAAVQAKVEGIVLLEAIVQTDGTVGEVRVRRSLDRQFGQDDEAVATIKKWQFAAGTKDGVAVPVLVEIELTFTLRDKIDR